MAGSPICAASSVASGTPWRDIAMARCAASSVAQSGCAAQNVAGPYDSVSPYMCVTRNPIRSIAAITGDGGAAPPVITSTGWSKRRFAASGACTSMLSTIGAPHRCVTACSQIAANTAAGSTLRRHTCVAPAAVTAQVNVQPLQWNIGSVHR